MGKKEIFPKSPNSGLQKGFIVAQVAKKHGWPESLVWAVKLDQKNDLPKYRELQWGIKKGRLKLCRLKAEVCYTHFNTSISLLIDFLNFFIFRGLGFITWIDLQYFNQWISDVPSE